MKYDYTMLDRVSGVQGESFYILDSEQFRKNFIELIDAFRKYYPETYIAYSYKTNYTPKLCKIVNELGGYAEVVSDMEVELAKRVGVPAEKIVFNGPYKNISAVKRLLLEGGCVNVDSYEELQEIADFALKNQETLINIGIRVNFDIQDGVLSRFGIDIESEKFKKVVQLIGTIPNIRIREMHCHYAVRRLETWASRVAGMIKVLSDNPEIKTEHIDLGGGLFGKMKESLKVQFDSYIPDYTEYAEAVAKKYAEAINNWTIKPKLFIEPGSALVGDCMKFAAKITGIKSIRGKNIATVLGSIYNINPTLNQKNPPIEIVHNMENVDKFYKDIDFGGFTCIESDYLYRHFDGRFAIGDYVVFDNVGSYSVVLKPPFILPNFAVVDFVDNAGSYEVVKRREEFDDLFHTFEF